LAVLVVALLNGIFIGIFAEKWKVRNRPTGLIMVAISTLLFFLSFYLAGYAEFISTARDYLVKNNGDADISQAIILADRVIEEETQQTGFGGYIIYQAKNEFVDNYRKKASGNLFTAIGEVIGALVVASSIYLFHWKSVSSRPFCKQCQSWFTSQYIGTVLPDHTDDFLSLIQNDEYAQAGEYVLEDAYSEPGLKLYSGKCACPSNDRLLNITQWLNTASGKLASRELIVALISPHEEAELIQAVKQSKLNFSTSEAAGSS
jgi:hypothetical protein